MVLGIRLGFKDKMANGDMSVSTNEISTLRKRLNCGSLSANHAPSGAEDVRQKEEVRDKYEERTEEETANIMLQQICATSDANRLILDSFSKLAKQAGLKSFENVRSIYLSPVPFSIANGQLTVTMKLCRHVLRKAFSKQISDLYRSGPTLKSGH
ncbi:unnamed protein product [Protopolystoma xenopodis]|uniref:Uncharacterized protein n=1 Tax=Protopolystoma xenopodis TaxID=117903 RepID=A0A3S4ZBZ2_9PLAT|nr:unnamed protein product [Protopolystoma xenopodis]